MRMRWPVAAAAMTSCLVLAGCGGQSHPAATEGSGAASSTTVASGPTTTVGVQRFGPAVRTWFATNEPAIQAVENDAAALGASGAAGAQSPTAVTCQQLATDVATAQRIAPIPAQGIQGEWQQALTSFATAAQACLRGFTSNDATWKSQFQEAIATGVRAQATAVQAIENAP